MGDLERKTGKKREMGGWMAVCGSARSCHLYLYSRTLTQTAIDRGAQASGGSALQQPRGGFCAKARAGASDRQLAKCGFRLAALL